MRPTFAPLFAAACLIAALPVHAGTPIDRGSPAQAAAAAALVEETQPVDRFIVKLRDRSGDPKAPLAALGATFGERMDHLRAMSGGAQVVKLGRRMARAEARVLARRLAADPRVELVEPDVLMQPLVVPNDTYYAQQWHYYEAAGGIDLPAAWDITTGSSALTVAVLDTGVRPHVDLASRLTAGWDFVSDFAISNDGDGRDADPSDPGDYGCNGSTSSWHGTHVAGTIGAASNNGSGVTGINWVSKIQPVRVLGRCGGYTSDIADGMRWAAGIAVSGVPANPTPARVLNMSFGTSGTCGTTLQNAVNDVVARGTVVVVAAGNSSADVSNAQPANCNGVIAVAATTRAGGHASYSNYGAKVTISAPGGGAGGGVLSTLNTGSTTPADDSYAYLQGTSMAAPHVTGVVSLMLSVDPTLTPALVTQRLQQSARAFPAGSDCTTSGCGAGIVDAAAALRAVGGGVVPTWVTIAAENQAFSIAGTQTVRYGAGTTWVSKTFSGEGSCSNAVFGDPLPWVAKQCQIVSGGASFRTTIALENDPFTLVNASATVRYGAAGAYVSQAVSGGGQCTNVYFGNDPLPGTVKQCDLPAIATAWTPVADENGAYAYGGTKTVRYGAGSIWVVRSLTGGGPCTNAFFGDPVPGTVKQCQVLTTLIAP